MINKINNQHPSWQCRFINAMFRFFLKKKLGQIASEEDAEKRFLKVKKFRDFTEKYYLPSPANKKQSIMIENILAEWHFGGKNANVPIILYFHGGAFIIGSNKVYANFCYHLAKTVETDVLVFNYRLSPEFSFEKKLEDAMIVYEWLRKNHVNRKIIFAGDSAGGGLALSTMVSLKNQSLTLPDAFIGFSPSTDLAFSGASMTSNAESDAVVSVPLDIPLLHDVNVKDELVSPLYANFTGFPPLFIQVSNHEVLLDDAVRLAEKAEKQGVNVTLEIWNYVPHIWQFFAFFLPEAKEALQHVKKFVAKINSETK